MMKRNCSWTWMTPWTAMMTWNRAMTSSTCAPKANREACGSSRSSQASHHARDIVETAVTSGFFSRLVEAVKAAGLVDTLKSAGPFTLFAPTDEAFAKIPAEALDAVLKDPEKLKSILTYHVVPGRYRSSDLMGISALKTVQGQPLTLDTSVGVKVGSAFVIKADVDVRNGVIHVIDSVLMPE